MSVATGLTQNPHLDSFKYPKSKMQCDFPFHFPSTGNGREAGDRVPGVARAADSPPPPNLAAAAPVRDGRLPGAHARFPGFRDPSRPGLKNGKKNSQAKKNKKKLDENTFWQKKIRTLLIRSFRCSRR